MSRANIIFLAVCCAAWLLLYQLTGVQNRSLVVELRPQSGRAALLNIRPADRVPQSLPLRILLIHGLSASKAAMRQMAAELARWGSDCYLIDLPGHGSSPEPFTFQATASATDQAIQSLLSGPQGTSTSSPPLVVIGHSFGARVAIAAVQRHSQVAAMVALSPAAEGFEPEAMAPLLIVTGEFDFPFVRRGAVFLYEHVARTRLPELGSPGQWQSAAGPVRLVVLPWTDHSQTLFKPSSLQEIKMWLTRVSPAIAEIPFSPWAFSLRTQLRALFCLLSLLIWFPVVGLLADLVMAGKRGTNSEPMISLSTAGVPLICVYALAGSLATLVLVWMNPWERLGLMGGDYLTGLLSITGILGLVALRPEWKSMAHRGRALLCSALAWLILVAGCSPWITSEFVHLELNSIRFWRFPWIAFSVLPFFLFDEQVCRRVFRGLGAWRVLMFHFSTRFVLGIALMLGFFVLRNGQFLVVLILPGLLLTSFLCWCLAAWIHRTTGSVEASGLFGALATGWFFSVFFAQL